MNVTHAATPDTTPTRRQGNVNSTGHPRSRTARLTVLAAIASALALAAGVMPSRANAASTHPSGGTRGLGAGVTARLNKALQRNWTSTWAPGVIAGVWIGNRGWTAVRGSTRRAAGPRPVRADHTRIGSVTKTMIGTLILKLVDQGKLSLDDTIAKWFPTVPDANAITIRQLGDMSSGIASYTTDSSITDQYFASPTKPWSPDTLIAGGVAQPRLFTPGKGFNYSDTNFVMLGKIAEQVTGRPLSVLLRTMVFKPLHMTHSSYPTSNRLPAPSWRGYTIQGSEAGNALDATNWTPTFAAGAGQAISTLGDLHRWARAVGTGALLTRSTQRARLTPNPYSEANGRAYLFALGNTDGWLGHEGSIPGYNTELQYLPGRRATIVVMVNTDIGDAQAVSPASKVFDALARVVAPKHAPKPAPAG
jgi:D-alanyl-D-alanine carboxypeptidase